MVRSRRIQRYEQLHTVGQNATSKVYTLYLGYELTHTTEVYLDMESARRGLEQRAGLGWVHQPRRGAQQYQGSLADVPYVARIMIRQIIPLSDERVSAERGSAVSRYFASGAPAGNPSRQIHHA